jgi:hypothetical protein
MLVVLNKVDLLRAAPEGPAAWPIWKNVTRRASPSPPPPAAAWTNSPAASTFSSRAAPAASVSEHPPRPGRLLHRSGTVVAENYADDYIEMEARVGERALGSLKEYLVD